MLGCLSWSCLCSNTFCMCFLWILKISEWLIVGLGIVTWVYPIESQTTNPNQQLAISWENHVVFFDGNLEADVNSLDCWCRYSGGPSKHHSFWNQDSPLHETTKYPLKPRPSRIDNGICSTVRNIWPEKLLYDSWPVDGQNLILHQLIGWSWCQVQLRKLQQQGGTIHVLVL